jgi:signal transduction histidine kinase
MGRIAGRGWVAGVGRAAALRQAAALGRVAALGRAGLAAGFAVLLAADGVRVAAEGGSWPVALAAGAVVCGLALARDRNLTGTAAAGLLVWGVAAAVTAQWSLAAQPVFAPVAGLVVLGGAAVRTLPAARAAAIALAGTGIVAAGRAADSPGAAEAQALIGVLAWTAVVATGLWLRYQDEQRRAALAAVRQEVRLDLARELHDVVAHHITGLVVQTQAARLIAAQRPEPAGPASAGPGRPGPGSARAGGASADAVGPVLAGIETAGAAALAALRRVVGLLRDSGEGSSVRPGPEDLAELAARFAGHGPPVDLRLPTGPPDPSWPPELSSTVYRVVQESLTNAVRHAAGASLVIVTVQHDPRHVRVEVTDDGEAPMTAPARSGGYGLIGMRERVEALGGTLHAGPADANGHPGTASGPDPVHPTGHPGAGELADLSRPDPAGPGRGGWTVRAALPVPAPPAAAPPAAGLVVTRRGEP